MNKIELVLEMEKIGFKFDSQMALDYMGLDAQSLEFKNDDYDVINVLYSIDYGIVFEFIINDGSSYGKTYAIKEAVEKLKLKHYTIFNEYNPSTNEALGNSIISEKEILSLIKNKY